MFKKEKAKKEEAKKCKCSCEDNMQDAHEEPCTCTEDGACFCEGEKSECCCEAEPEILKAELAKAQAEVKSSHENFLRAMADLDTFRRRVNRDMEDMRKFSMQPLIEELIPAIDNLELGLAHAKGGENGKDLVVGIEMVLVQIKRVFENFGVKEISPLGEDFDPNFHDSVEHLPSDEYADNKVSAIIRKGYMLNGRLVRPASVIVSSGKKE